MNKFQHKSNTFSRNYTHSIKKGAEKSTPKRIKLYKLYENNTVLKLY